MTTTTDQDLTLAVDKRELLFINGAWVEPRSRHPMVPVMNAGDGEVLASVVQADTEDVDVAVHAAQAATDQWSRSSVEERAALLDRLADELEVRSGVIARTAALEVGTPLRTSTVLQVGLPVSVLRGFSQSVKDVAFSEAIGHSVVNRHAIGVVGAITPWNYPLHQIVAKVGAAIAAGCGIVLKPSNIAPMSAFYLAEAAIAAGMPNGLLNVLPGAGRTVGEAIAGHRGIEAVSFTGSTSAGARVAAVAAANITKVSLELGGKSASIIAEDADLSTAVRSSVRHGLMNSGQTCTAWTRLVVPRSKLGEVEELVTTEIARMPVGHPLADGTRLGPLASAEQKASVEAYVRAGKADGLRLLATGTVDDGGHPGGYYVAPVVFTDVDPAARLAQEEIFGPVLTIIPHDGLDHAVAIANDSEFGLAGAIWSQDEDKALTYAQQMRTGQVDVNGARFNALAPFGGFRRSGIGRELGRHGIEEFLEISAVQR
ncbi:aldehyde dehydrogenase family protein [Rhodococcus sp. NPDC057529]|uniref:aldehyde dehydrogenase family protein n=1 Tax=Rhodococcus sp. NPDC057529 TaxID=3346158 RepID=UPI00366B442B